MVVIVAVLEGAVLTHQFRPGKRGYRDDIEITEIPADTAGWHDDHSLPGATTEFAEGAVLWADGQLTFLAHLVETRLRERGREREREGGREGGREGERERERERERGGRGGGEGEGERERLVQP